MKLCSNLILWNTKFLINYSPGVQYIIKHFFPLHYRTPYLLYSNLLIFLYSFSSPLLLYSFSSPLSQLIYSLIYVIGWRTYIDRRSICARPNILSLGICSFRPVFDICPRYFPTHNNKCMITTTHAICHLIALSCCKRPPGPAFMPEFDAACLIKHYSVNGSGSGIWLDLPRLGLPGVAMLEMCNWSRGLSYMRKGMTTPLCQLVA